MYITAFFTDGFSPETGLSPTISVLRISDDTVIVPGAAMVESTLAGYYYYDFAAYDSTEEYAMVADGGSGLDDIERYKHGGIDEVGAILSKIDDILDDTDELQGDWTNGGRLDNILDAAAIEANVKDHVLNSVIEGTITLQDVLKVALAALAGKSDGAGSALQHFRDQADSLDRITASMDVSGNRLSITLDLG